MKVKVSVPATSANLGSGYDVYGLALSLYNHFIVEDSEEFAITIKGTSSNIPRTKENLFYESFVFLFHKLKIQVPVVKIAMDLYLPQGGGLGSSATAVVGGLLAANSFLGEKYTKEELLPFAIQMERGQNPDNVAPALLGGLIIMASENGQVIHAKVPFPKAIKAIIYTPDFSMDTVTTRKLMPSDYSKEDLIFSISRVGLFLAAIETKQYNLFRIAMQDKIHQPTRTKVFSQMPTLIEAAIIHGAFGAALSGGGSSIIALADKSFEKIASALVNTGNQSGLKGKTAILTATNKGAVIRKYKEK